MARSKRGGYQNQRGGSTNRAAALLSHVGRNDGQRDTYNNVRGTVLNQHFVNPSRSGGGTVQHFNHSSTPSISTQQNYANSSYSNQYHGDPRNRLSSIDINHAASGKERRVSRGLLGQSPYVRNSRNETWGSAGSSNLHPYGDSSGHGGGYNDLAPSNNFMENITANITEIVSKNLASLLGHQGQGFSHNSYRDNRSNDRIHGRALEDRLGPAPHKTHFIVRDNIGPKNFNRIRANNTTNRKPSPRNRQLMWQKQPNPPKVSSGKRKKKPSTPNNRNIKFKMAFTNKGAKDRAKFWKNVKVDYTLTITPEIVNTEQDVIVIDSENPAQLEDTEPKAVEMETDAQVEAQPESTVIARPDSVEPAEHENLDFGYDIPEVIPPQSEEMSAENRQDANIIEAKSETENPTKSELETSAEVTDITPTEILDEGKEVQVIETSQGKKNRNNRYTQPRMMRDDIIQLTVEKTACAIHSVFVEAEMKIAELLGKNKAETPYFSITLSTNSEGIENAPGKLFEEGFEVPDKSAFKYMNHLPIFNNSEEGA